jgi:hypothetical protein
MGSALQQRSIDLFWRVGEGKSAISPKTSQNKLFVENKNLLDFFMLIFTV